MARDEGLYIHVSRIELEFRYVEKRGWCGCEITLQPSLDPLGMKWKVRSAHLHVRVPKGHGNGLRIETFAQVFTLLFYVLECDGISRHGL